MFEINIAVTCTIISVTVAILTYLNGRKKDTTNDTIATIENDVTVKSQLAQIQQRVDEIKRDVTEINISVRGVNDRLIRAEEAIKNIQKEIDILKQNK